MVWGFTVLLCSSGKINQVHQVYLSTALNATRKSKFADVEEAASFLFG